MSRTTKNKHRWAIVFAIVVAISVLSGCVSGVGSSAGTTPPPADSAPYADVPPLLDEPDAAPLQAEESMEPESTEPVDGEPEPASAEEAPEALYQEIESETPEYEPVAPTEESPEQPPEESAGTRADGITVYVSNHGNKIHSESDCSGMKNYSTMTLTEARKATSDYCDNCAEHLVSVD